jgi:hypothetical protein
VEPVEPEEGEEGSIVPRAALEDLVDELVPVAWEFGTSDASVEPFSAVDTYALEIGYFAEYLRSGTRPLHTEKEGVEVLCLILAA